ncbi:MAG TPA: calcium-binding protein [Chroococcales cyanobacterium]|jgi:Ca2+-binding RTX toxin-like protein
MVVKSGSNFSEQLKGTLGNDSLYGLGGNDTLTGYGGNDYLDGGTGNDLMQGGTGNDTYIVDSIFDIVKEKSGQGIDAVKASVSYTLGSNVENLTLTGSSAINGTGNSLNNVITGNSGNNTLDGGLGADTMNGGDGSDTYIVDNIGDVVAESFNDSFGGVDTVLSSVSYSIAPGTTSGQQGYGIENLTLTGSGNINATGNGNNNTITGNSGNNTLNGGVGNDSLIGGDGNDSLIGGDGNDSLVGGVGNDSLTGGLGIDTLWGNQGADKFIFNSLSEGIDIIKDFQWTEGDVIQVSALGFGASSLSQFSYNTSTGALFFDPFGSVGPTQFATIENKPAGFSTNIDIVLV